jgi:hypothetical protein
MADEPVVSLNQPVAARGTPRTFFFNGRLLSAEDLRREQSLRENGQSQLARLLGCGIAGGLSVTQTGNSRIDIASGLGVTPSGRIIDLIGQTIDLAGMAAAVRPGGFGDCAAAMANRERPAAGIYLLVLTPAWLASGRAATLLGEVGACNRNLEQPAVRARLLAVVAPAGSTDANARNAIAHALLADADPASLPTQPDVVNPPSGGQSLIGWWPAQVVPTLAADDLPLAVLRIDPYAKLVWLDAAAAQRRLAPPPGLAGDSFWRESHAIEMEAFARQFVDQLSDQAGDQDALNGQKVDPPSSSRAARFTFLPPLLRLDARQLLLLRGQLGETLSLTDAYSIGRADFVAELHQGLHDSTLALADARPTLWQLRGSDPPQYLLRLNHRSDLGQMRGEDGEQSSKRLASLAGQVLHDRTADAEKRSLAASVLTQAPNKPPRTHKPKPA